MGQYRTDGFGPRFMVIFRVGDRLARPAGKGRGLMRFRLEWLGAYLPGELPDPLHLRRRLTDVGFIGEGVEGTGPDAVLDVR